MRYGISVWNYMEPGIPVTGSIEELAQFGFDSMALQLHFLARLTATEAAELGRVISDRDLRVTLHTNFALLRVDDLKTATEIFGARLEALTLDSASKTDSRGTFYDMDEMAAKLAAIAEAAPAIRFGVEDFPLDERALKYYRPALAPFLENPNYGALLDLGHVNLRQRTLPYFRETDCAATVRQLPVPLIEVHVHDNDGTRDEHRHPGEGNADLAGAARGLREIGFDGTCTIEVSPGMHGAEVRESKPRLGQSLELWRRLMETP